MTNHPIVMVEIIDARCSDVNALPGRPTLSIDFCYSPGPMPRAVAKSLDIVTEVASFYE